MTEEPEGRTQALFGGNWVLQAQRGETETEAKWKQAGKTRLTGFGEV